MNLTDARYAGRSGIFISYLIAMLYESQDLISHFAGVNDHI